MRDLGQHGTLDDLSPEVLSALQLHTINEPLFPNLQTIELWHVTEKFIPFLPMFLSPTTTDIEIIFGRSDLPESIVVPVIATLTTQCPNLQDICLHPLPRDPMIAGAVSKMLLASDWNSLQYFCVQSPLTEEAREVVCKLPNLHVLWVIIEGPTSFPTMILPNLTGIDIEYDHDCGWLEGFRGATLGKLASINFRPTSTLVGGFLEAFERVALTTSIPATLSAFEFHTSLSWRPNYHSLLLFTQLKDLDIGFSCEHGCSSTIDDEIITDIARAMPGLETLRLGGSPCETSTGVTTKGLATLAHCCPRLSRLCIHFQVVSLDPPVIPRTIYDGRPTVPREACALIEFDVGEIPVPEESTLMVALTLLRIFPHIEYIKYSGGGAWGKVSTAIHRSKQLVHHSGEKPSFTQPQSEVNNISPRSRARVCNMIKKYSEVPECSDFVPTPTHFRILPAPHVVSSRRSSQ